MRNRLREHLVFMQSLARIAGAIMRTHWKKPVATKRKPDRTLVSEVDLRISNHICQKVKQTYPTYGLLTEESFSEYRPASRGFIVDELDGTRAYLQGETGFTFQIAYFEDYDEILIGLIYDPVKDVMIWSIRGEEVIVSEKGFTRSITPIKVKNFGRLKYGHHRKRFTPTLWNIYQELAVQPEQIVSSGSIGSKAMDMVLGKFDVILGPHRHIPVWDWAAGKVMAETLGYKICHFDGSPLHCSEVTTPHPFGYLICPKEHINFFLDRLEEFFQKKTQPQKVSLK